MKVSYKLTISGAYETLFDETAVESGDLSDPTGPGVQPEFKPQFSGMLQEEPLSFSDSQFRTGKGNKRCVLPLSFNMEYATYAAAFASIRAFGGLLLEKVTIKVEQGVEVQYYPNAVLEEYTPELLGCSVYHSLVFKTDNVTAEEP